MPQKYAVLHEIGTNQVIRAKLLHQIWDQPFYLACIEELHMSRRGNRLVECDISLLVILYVVVVDIIELNLHCKLVVTWNE